MSLWEKKILSFISLWSDEEGQATTEYILILAVVITFLMSIVKKLIQPMFAQLMQAVSKRIESEFFGANLHYFRMKK